MNFKFENQGTNTYLVYEIKSDDVINTMSLGMLVNNKISGLASTIFTQMNTNKYIKYDVSTKISAKQIFNGIVNKKRLLGVFSGIIDALLSVEDYMIDMENIILDLDYIFSDVTTCDTVLICLPIEMENQYSSDLGLFFRNIIFSTQFDQTENCDYVAKIISYLNSMSMFSLNDFKRLLDDIKSKEINNNDISSIGEHHTVTVKKVEQGIQTTPSAQNSSNQQVNYGTYNTNNQLNNAQKQVQQSVGSQVNYNSNNIQYNNQKSGNYNSDIQSPQSQKSNNYNGGMPNPAPQKSMTLLNLLMHYNKENAELYKAQKAMKKSQKGVQSQGIQNPQNNQNNTSVPSNVPFVVPGQPIAVNTDIDKNNQNSFQSVQKFDNSYSNQNNIANMQNNIDAVNSYNNQNRNSNIGINTDFGETTELGGAGYMPTMDLSDVNIDNFQKEIKKKPFLIKKSDNKKIDIDKNVFTIGREENYVDYFIDNSIYVGRVHATIIQKNNKYYIIDNNSRNHTFVNDNIITSSTEIEINSGDIIRFANEEFEFKCF